MKNLKLFTPGPLETKLEYKQSMLRDIGSRDNELMEMTSRIRSNILRVANAYLGYTCIPIQGSGTFGIEAAIDTFLSSYSKPLVLVNGIYGERIVNILERKKQKFRMLRVKNNKIPNIIHVENILKTDQEITHGIFVYCETTTGIVNPFNKLISLFNKHNKRTIVDAVSAFGALPVDPVNADFDVLVTSSNKCIESVPGVSIVISKSELISSSENNATSYCLDLYQQWRYFETTGQWRFTPPTHVIQSLDLALIDLLKETVKGRYERYTRNKNIVVEGLKSIGLVPCIDDKYQSPICLAFSISRLNYFFRFKEFYEKLKEKNILIYHALDDITSSFRIGCIGNLETKDFVNLTTVIQNVFEEIELNSMLCQLTKESA